MFEGGIKTLSFKYINIHTDVYLLKRQKLICGTEYRKLQ